MGVVVGSYLSTIMNIKISSNVKMVMEMTKVTIFSPL